MDKDFEKLLNEAKKLANKRILSEYAYCGHVACALLTKDGNIYTGINLDSNCSLGNCAEYAAIAEMIVTGHLHIVLRLTKYSLV